MSTKMYYKKGTSIENVGLNFKVAEECPEGYVTFEEMKEASKAPEPEEVEEPEPEPEPEVEEPEPEVEEPEPEPEPEVEEPEVQETRKKRPLRRGKNK